MYHFSLPILLIIATTSLQVYAVDENVIEKSLRNSRTYQNEDNRFSLVGVIAEGESGGKGIAVIRDLQKDKTHTLKIGEKVPGHPELTLTKVSRQVVVLHGAKSDIFVGTNLNSSAKSGDPNELDSEYALDADQKSMVYEPDDDDEDQETTGLFEKWYQNKGPAVLSPSSEMSNRNRSHAQVGSVDRDLPTPIRSSSDENIHGRDSNSFDDANASESGDDDQALPTRTEYSDAMRALIDSYLNGDSASSVKTH